MSTAQAHILSEGSSQSLYVKQQSNIESIQTSPEPICRPGHVRRLTTPVNSPLYVQHALARPQVPVQAQSSAQQQHMCTQRSQQQLRLRSAPKCAQGHRSVIQRSSITWGVMTVLSEDPSQGCTGPSCTGTYVVLCLQCSK
jgi:hypothetical protein